MKRLLIIQLDDPYFLFESLQVLDRFRASFKEYELTILVEEKSLEKLSGVAPVISGITSDKPKVLSQQFDASINLSMQEVAWTLHDLVQSEHKAGPIMKNGQLLVSDIWSSYLLTLKARAPFLTFHMQEIYQNILGIKKGKSTQARERSVNRIAFGSFNPALFSGHELEKLVNFVNNSFPNLPILDVTEVDLISDLSQTLYIGPANFEALQLCEFGARGIFLGSHFQGFNLLPSGEGHYYISSRGEKIHSADLESFVRAEIAGEKPHFEMPHSIYVTDEEHLFGSYLTSLNRSDDNYPFYQSHVVLWSYLLNQYETNLAIPKCSVTQTKLLKQNQEVLAKLIRLYDYAMSSIDRIHTESKLPNADVTMIQSQLQNLREIDAVSDQISQSHSFLRPFLDFYRIRRGQNHGTTLFEQSQHSFLTYSEEHTAMKALEELFSVTLQKNEVNI